MFRAEYLTELLGGETVKIFLSLCTDSRQYNGEDVFWCLNGPSFCGSDYIEDVYTKGCLLFVLEKAYYKSNFSKKYPKATFLTTNDALDSLQKLATKCIIEEKNRGLINIGITGSNGKTTTKEIIYFILKKIFGHNYVTATKNNFNNHLGVPLTILSMDKETRFLIVEMGTNHPGEIEKLVHLSRPDVGIITNIGEAHLEFFQNKEGVLKEKSYLYEYIEHHSKRPLAIINADDEMLTTCDYPFAITFSRDQKLKTTYHYTIDDKNNIVVCGYKNYLLTNHNIQEHYNLVNLLHSTLFLIHLLPHKEKEILSAAADVSTPDNNRSTWKQYQGFRVFLDAYNANPSSMRAALESFKEATKDLDPDKVLIVLGDMNELGKKTSFYHRSIGAFTKNQGFKNVCFIGSYSQHYLEGHDKGIAFKNTTDFLERWTNVSNSYKAIFLKGSRSLQLESLLDII